MRTYRNCHMLFPASFKLALMCCSCMHHLLPWVASCSFVMHHARVCIMPCSCVVCLPCCVLILDSSRVVAIVRIRSSSWPHLHGFVLLPSRISGKMTVTLDLITIIAMSCLECMCCTVTPFEHVLYVTCLELHVVSYYLVASLFWECLLDVWMHFASMPCLTCFAHIF